MKETDKINLDLQDFKEGDVITNFIPIPVSLFSSSLSSTIILIYACILNRAELSGKNGWKNKNGAVYVRFTIGKPAPSYYIEQQDLTTKDRYCYEEGESL